MLKIKIVFFAFEIRLPTTIKNVTSACKKWTHLACARVSCFPFLPSPFTSMPYFLIDKRLQVKAKTVFAFTPCDLPFLTRRGREIPHENAEKQWTLNKNVPTFVPKPTTIQATPAQR